MTDRELLEMAAKAAGIELPNPTLRVTHMRGVAPKLWNPLTDDGDALRLAVKLRMEIDCYYGEVASGEEGDRNQTLIVDNDRDPYAATRRAIVRAAAAIGRTPSTKEQ